MLKIIIPRYMITANDSPDKMDESYGIINLEYEERNIIDTLILASQKCPDAFTKLLEDKNIRQNIIVVLNDNIIKRKDFTSLIIKNGDIIELFMQFAGG